MAALYVPAEPIGVSVVRILLGLFVAAGTLAGVGMASSSAQAASVQPLSNIVAQAPFVQGPADVVPAYWVYRHHRRYWVAPRRRPPYRRPPYHR